MNGKENTFRRLAGQPLLISSIRCYIGLHSWTQWSEPKREGRHEFSDKIIQDRYCRYCNIYERRQP